MPIFSPTGIKRFEELPLLTVDEQNENNVSLLSINNDGKMFKTPINSLKSYIGLSYTNLETDNENQMLLGRYSVGGGNIQRILIGDNISLNSTTGLLDSTITIGGEAGGDFIGQFPAPELKEGSVTLPKLQHIEGDAILGRGGELPGEVEVIRIGAEFTIDPDTKTLHLSQTIGNIADTGWIVREKTVDFTAVSSHMYFVFPLAEELITVTIPEGWRAGEQIVIVNKGEGNVLVNTPLEFIDFETNNLRAINLISDGNDNYFNI